MADFVRLSATAKRLIDENGRQVTVIKLGKDPQDQTMPWRGQGEYHEAEVVGRAAFVPQTLLLTTLATNEDGVLKEAKYALFAADDDAGYSLEEFNVIQDGDSFWKIVRTEILAPADKRVLYMFQVVR